MHDELQELRINQYGQYIHEKLGLFKRPTKLELMLFNFKRGVYDQEEENSVIFNTPESRYQKNKTFK